MTHLDSESKRRIIECVAARHGVSLSHDDPILMVHTLNEILLEENVQAHRQLLNDFRSLLEQNASRFESRNSVLPYSSRQHTQSDIRLLAETIMQQIDARLNEKLTDTAAIVNKAKSASIIYLASTTILIITIIIVLLIL